MPKDADFKKNALLNVFSAAADPNKNRRLRAAQELFARTVLCPDAQTRFIGRHMHRKQMEQSVRCAIFADAFFGLRAEFIRRPADSPSRTIYRRRKSFFCAETRKRRRRLRAFIYTRKRAIIYDCGTYIIAGMMHIATISDIYIAPETAKNGDAVSRKNAFKTKADKN